LYLYALKLTTNLLILFIIKKYNDYYSEYFIAYKYKKQ
jgi:hypothetical protein